MTKLPAGNSHRHQQPEDSTLWDRLRADLNNLGAAYGPITEGVGEAVVTPEPVEICACCKETGGWHTWRCESGPHPASLYPDKPTTAQLSDTDRNAYFDGIILAARKKRVSTNSEFNPPSTGHVWHERADFCTRCEQTGVEIVEHDGCYGACNPKAANVRRHLSAAMSRPLDWEPRVGGRFVR